MASAATRGMATGVTPEFWASGITGFGAACGVVAAAATVAPALADGGDLGAASFAKFLWASRSARSFSLASSFSRRASAAHLAFSASASRESRSASARASASAALCRRRASAAAILCFSISAREGAGVVLPLPGSSTRAVEARREPWNGRAAAKPTSGEAVVPVVISAVPAKVVRRRCSAMTLRGRQVPPSLFA